MDIRSTFLNYLDNVMYDGVTQEAKSSLRLDV